MRFLATLFALIFTTSAGAAAPATQTFDLDNGLQLLVRQDHRAPVVVVMVWYKVGSMDEPAGMTGISHMLEHMLFKNTKHLAPGDFSALVSRFGGRSNAFTFTDYTGYFQTYESSRLPMALELEAERMANLRIDEEEFAREVQVVLEERSQRTDDNPNRLAWERFSAVAYPGTGYAHPIIGWRNEIEQYSADQILNWYHRWYTPANATLVVVGNVDPEQVYQLAERFFGDLHAPAVPRRPRPVTLPDPGERQLDLTLPVQVPLLMKAWNVPSISTANEHRDYYTLAMLEGILDGGRSGRIERMLVRDQQVATYAGVSYRGDSRGDGLFVFSGAPAPGVSLDTLESAFMAQLQALRDVPPDEQELQRVRAHVLANQIYAQDSVMGQGMQLGWDAMLGLDPDFHTDAAKQLAKVTPADVQRMLQRWFIVERSTTARVMPSNGEKP